MVNWDRIAELQEEIGQEDFVEVIDMFFEEVEEVLTTLGDDSATISRDLHFLKGSALNLGFDAMATLCKDAETATEVKPSIPLIRTAYKSAKAEIAAIQ